MLSLIVNLFYPRQTGVALGVEVDDKMPQHEYYEYFGPDYALHVAPSNMENKNSRQLLEEIRNKLLDNLSKLQHAPSVQFQERPPDTELPEVFSAAIFCVYICLFLVLSYVIVLNSGISGLFIIKVRIFYSTCDSMFLFSAINFASYSGLEIYCNCDNIGFLWVSPV